MRSTFCWSAACLGGLLMLAVAPAHGVDIVIQGEDFATEIKPDGSLGFEIASIPGDQGGGSAAFFRGETPDHEGPSRAPGAYDLVYELSDVPAGEYTIYYRIMIPGAEQDENGGNGGGSADSFYAPTVFGDPDPGAMEQGRVNQNTSQASTTGDANGAGRYFWLNVDTHLGQAGDNVGFPAGTGPLNSFGRLTSTGGPTQYVHGGREDGLYLDSIVLSTQAGLQVADLNTIAGIVFVPEPSALALLSVAGLGLIGRRRG